MKLTYAKKHTEDGCWIHFEDGHSEFWNNFRLENELTYRGLDILTTQIKLLQKYKLFCNHVASHKEVKEAPINPGQVMCKICNRTFMDITHSEDIIPHIERLTELNKGKQDDKNM